MKMSSRIIREPGWKDLELYLNQISLQPGSGGKNLYSYLAAVEVWLGIGLTKQTTIGELK